MPTRTALLDTDLTGADLTGCRIYGVSAWGLKLDKDTKQRDLVITPPGEPDITCDDIEVAQFIYLMMHNEKLKRIKDLFAATFDVLLYDLTSTYFESPPPADEADKRRHGSVRAVLRPRGAERGATRHRPRYSDHGRRCPCMATRAVIPVD
jgi:hypothetical protein